MPKKKKAPKTLLSTPVVLDGRAIPAWGMVLTADLLTSQVRGLSAVALRLWLSLIAVAGGNTTGWNCSVKHLVTMVGASDRQVYRAMTDLEKAGLLRRHRTGRSTRYELVSPGQLARVGKAPTPDRDDSSDSRENADKDDSSDLPSDVRSELTDPTVEASENEAQNREPDALQKDPTDSSHREPPFPPRGGDGEGDMSDMSVKDATRTREASHVDTVSPPRGIRALHEWPCGPLLKGWVDEMLEGKSGSEWRQQRDVVSYYVNEDPKELVGLVAAGMKVRTRKAAELLADALPSAVHYVSQLEPEPFCLETALDGYRDRLEKQNLLDLAHACESEEELNRVLRDLVMRECGF